VPDQLTALTQINLDDLVSSFGWQKHPLLATTLRRFFAAPARKFAGQMVEYDNLVGEVGLAEASRRTLHTRYVSDVRVFGRMHIPASGPLLILSNHPGMADTICLFTAINRPDLNIIALHRPFLVSLVNVTRNLFYVSDNATERMHAIRQVSVHLREGHAALTFPAGHIEPDPDSYEGALDSLNDWTDSAGVFLRFARGTRIVPALVSGVVWEKTAHHILLRIKKTKEEKEKLAAALQLLTIVTRNVRPTRVKVQFAEPITIDEIGSTGAQAIHQVVLSRMRRLIEYPYEGEGESVL